MRVAVTGATGNVGSAVVSALARDPAVDSVIAIARRTPSLKLAKVHWRSANVAIDPMAPLFEGADAVVHLAWLIQPSRDQAALRATNVDGSRRVFEATAAAGVASLVYASSVGAYSEGPKDRAVDESWPTNGIESSFYSRHKSEVERALDEIEARDTGLRVVRLRPGLIFRRESATGIRRLFLGPLFPGGILRLGIPIVPQMKRLRFQAVHTEDVAEAFRLAVVGKASGAFNVAAEPVLDPPALASLFGARQVGVSPTALRAAAAATWKLRLQPSPPGWLDMALAVPIMSSGRAREELGWAPKYSATDALLELIDGLRAGSGYPTPPLDPATSGRLRISEFRTGVGAVSH